MADATSVTVRRRPPSTPRMTSSPRPTNPLISVRAPPRTTLMFSTMGERASKVAFSAMT